VARWQPRGARQEPGPARLRHARLSHRPGCRRAPLPAGCLATRTLPSSSRRSRGKSAASPCGHVGGPPAEEGRAAVPARGAAAPAPRSRPSCRCPAAFATSSSTRGTWPTFEPSTARTGGTMPTTGATHDPHESQHFVRRVQDG
jgi:hypothetical protein